MPIRWETRPAKSCDISPATSSLKRLKKWLTVPLLKDRSLTLRSKALKSNQTRLPNYLAILWWTKRKPLVLKTFFSQKLTLSCFTSVCTRARRAESSLPCCNASTRNKKTNGLRLFSLAVIARSRTTTSTTRRCLGQRCPGKTQGSRLLLKSLGSKGCLN